MCGVFEVLFQSDVSGRDIDHLQTHCGGRTQYQVQCSSAIPIYQDHVTIHLHYDSLVFKIRSRLDKHMLDGCWVSMLLSQGLYHTWQVVCLIYS